MRSAIRCSAKVLSTFAVEAQNVRQKLERDAAGALDAKKRSPHFGRQLAKGSRNDDAVDGDPMNFKAVEDAFNVFGHTQNWIGGHKSSDVAVGAHKAGEANPPRP